MAETFYILGMSHNDFIEYPASKRGTDHFHPY